MSHKTLKYSVSCALGLAAVLASINGQALQPLEVFVAAAKERSPERLEAEFGAGINLDSSTIQLGVVSMDSAPPARALVDSFKGNNNFQVVEATSTQAMGDALRAGSIQGFVVIRSDLSRQLVTSALDVQALQIINGWGGAQQCQLRCSVHPGCHSQLVAA